MSDVIYHIHHIIPRHMGGTDDPSNLIKLTIQEHAEAHRLLWEKYRKPADLWAWKILLQRFDWSDSERQAWVELSREKMKKNNVGAAKRWEEMKTDANPMKTLRTNSGSFKKGHSFGPRSPQTKEKMRQSKLGELNPNYKNPNCTKHLNSVMLTCPHCGLTLSAGNAKRWHFDKCKQNCSK